MKNKELLSEIDELKTKVEFLFNCLEKCNEKQQKQAVDFYIYEKNIIYREYLMNTSFIGKLKNKKIIEEFKKYKNTIKMFGNSYVANFNEIKSEITNYDFFYLDVFKKELEKYEKEQEILDKYQEENKKEKKENK